MGKIQRSLALPNFKFNCAVLFLRQTLLIITARIRSMGKVMFSVCLFTGEGPPNPRWGGPRCTPLNLGGHPLGTPWTWGAPLEVPPWNLGGAHRGTSKLGGYPPELGGMPQGYPPELWVCPGEIPWTLGYPLNLGGAPGIPPELWVCPQGTPWTWGGSVQGVPPQNFGVPPGVPPEFVVRPQGVPLNLWLGP